MYWQGLVYLLHCQALHYVFVTAIPWNCCTFIFLLVLCYNFHYNPFWMFYSSGRFVNRACFLVVWYIWLQSCCFCLHWECIMLMFDVQNSMYLYTRFSQYLLNTFLRIAVHVPSLKLLCYYLHQVQMTHYYNLNYPGAYLNKIYSISSNPTYSVCISILFLYV